MGRVAECIAIRMATWWLVLLLSLSTNAPRIPAIALKPAKYRSSAAEFGTSGFSLKQSNSQ